MKNRFYIYFILILVFTGTLIYANYFMKPAELEDRIIIEHQIEPPQEENPLGEGVKPDFLPEQISESLLLTAEKYDFYYYLFLYPYKKVVLYTYTPGSTRMQDSEDFHKKISAHIAEKLYINNYKIITTTVKGAVIYEKGLLDKYEEAFYEEKEGDSVIHKKRMLEKKASIDEVREFYNKCANGLCIIYGEKGQYVAIDKRDINVAIKLLEDYKDWK